MKVLPRFSLETKSSPVRTEEEERYYVSLDDTLVAA